MGGYRAMYRRPRNDGARASGSLPRLLGPALQRRAAAPGPGRGRWPRPPSRPPGGLGCCACCALSCLSKKGFTTKGGLRFELLFPPPWFPGRNGDSERRLAAGRGASGAGWPCSRARASTLPPPPSASSSTSRPPGRGASGALPGARGAVGLDSKRPSPPPPHTPFPQRGWVQRPKRFVPSHGAPPAIRERLGAPAAPRPAGAQTARRAPGRAAGPPWGRPGGRGVSGPEHALADTGGSRAAARSAAAR